MKKWLSVVVCAVMLLTAASCKRQVAPTDEATGTIVQTSETDLPYATQLPDRTFEEAGSLAAWYSKGRGNEKVEIDYIQRKHVKKAAGGAPGFVIYHTNYSLIASPSCNLKEVQ